MRDEQLAEAIRALHAETVNMRRELARFVHLNAAQLEGQIFEEINGQTPPAGGGVVTDEQGPAQTSSVEMITGLLVIVPAGTTLATLTLGEHVIPLQNTATLWSPLQIKVRHHARKLVYTAPANATAAYAAFWGYAVPTTNAPGRLH